MKEWSRILWIESLAECCDNFMKNFVNEKFHKYIWLLFDRLFVYSIPFLLCDVLLCPLLFSFSQFLIFHLLCVKWFLGILLSAGVCFICNNDTKSLIKDRFLFIFAAFEHSVMQWRENKIFEFHPWAIGRKPR